MNERRSRSFFCKAHKSLNLHNLTKKFLLTFITQSYLKIDHNLKQIDFLVNYTTVYLPRMANFLCAKNGSFTAHTKGYLDRRILFLLPSFAMVKISCSPRNRPITMHIHLKQLHSRKYGLALASCKVP